MKTDINHFILKNKLKYLIQRFQQKMLLTIHD